MTTHAQLKARLELAADDNATLKTENDHLASLCKAKDNSADYHRRELEKARRLFMELYELNRTADLRYSWLEEAAREVCTTCEKHQPAAIVKLADEIGLDLASELIEDN